MMFSAARQWHVVVDMMNDPGFNCEPSGFSVQRLNVQLFIRCQNDSRSPQPSTTYTRVKPGLQPYCFWILLSPLASR
jgi:hypothetical protein